jgi:succinate dehydrogenase/fumarate reductase flavoprotein subunit
MPHCFQRAQGVVTYQDQKTSVDGLHVSGAAAHSGSGLAGGIVAGGLIIGDTIKSSVQEAGDPVIDEAQVESQKEAALRPLAVKDGTEPMELECAIRYVCQRYVGQFKSEGKLREGLRRIGSLRREFLPKLMAKNPHYLMRVHECRNVMDLAEVHMNAVLERKESRGNHIRVDYPERDKSLDNMVTYQRLKDGKSVLERKKIPGLTPENAKRFAEIWSGSGG